jgi:exosortase/archaeosortase family protein
MRIKLDSIRKIRLSREQQKLWQTFVFLFRLLVLSIPLYLIISLGISLYPLQYSVATNSYWVLRFTGFQVVQEGATLTVGPESEVRQGFTFTISEDSTAWKSMLFFFALVFAVPAASGRKRLMGLLIGIPLVWVGNLARVWGIVMVERSYGIQAALIAHDYLWRVGLIALVLALWLVWLRFSKTPVTVTNIKNNITNNK